MPQSVVSANWAKKEFAGMGGPGPGIAMQCVCLAWLCVRAHLQQTHPADVLVSVQALTTTPDPPVVGEPVLLTNTAVGLVLGVAYDIETTLWDLGVSPRLVIFQASQRIWWNGTSVETRVPPLLRHSESLQAELIFFDALLHDRQDEDALLGKKVIDLVVSKPDASVSRFAAKLNLLWPPPGTHLLMHPIEVRLEVINGSEAHAYEKAFFALDASENDKWIEFLRYVCQLRVCVKARERVRGREIERASKGESVREINVQYTQWH
jgi:hypothetical protein